MQTKKWKRVSRKHNEHTKMKQTLIWGKYDIYTYLHLSCVHDCSKRILIMGRILGFCGT